MKTHTKFTNYTVKNLIIDEIYNHREILDEGETVKVAHTYEYSPTKYKITMNSIQYPVIYYDWWGELKNLSGRPYLKLTFERRYDIRQIDGT